MKVVKLTSSNVKRLTAVEISPGDEPVVIVGGVNGAGKSSVLDAISMALGGSALVPDEPIRLGEKEAITEVDLGDIVVTRKFKREHLLCDCAAGRAAVQQAEVQGGGTANVIHDPVHDPGCASERFGPTRSSLLVRNKDGATYSSPQAMLDKLLGKLTFDPLAFSRMHPNDQATTLRQLVGLDTKALDSEYGIDYSARAQLNKQLAEAQIKLKNLPKHEGLSTIEVDVTDLIEQLKKADELRTSAREASARAVSARETIVVREQNVDKQRQHIAYLEKQLRDAQEALNLDKDKLTEARNELSAREQQANETLQSVPDIDSLNKKLSESTEINKKVQDNRRYTEQEREVSRIKGDISSTEARMKQNLADKQAKLAALKFPVDGLAFNEHGVTYNGVPLSQVSTAERTRISVAIGLALNPKVRVLLVRDGSLLDDNTIKSISEQAKAADTQLWLEYMTANKEGVTVMIEDGAVV